MGQARFLARVHERVQQAVKAGAILDAYRLADELIAGDLSYSITRPEAVKTILAATVVYGGSLVLDPEYEGYGITDYHGKSGSAANGHFADGDEDEPLLLRA
jgi:hypothetical protein